MDPPAPQLQLCCRRPPLPPYNGWEKAFLGPWPAPSWRRTRAASSKCWVIYGLRAAWCFSAPPSRSASLPRRPLSCCSSAPLPAFRDPGAQQAVRPGLPRGAAVHSLDHVLASGPSLNLGTPGWLLEIANSARVHDSICLAV
jgi:hypothetical protein